ncbi:MAG: HEAT repeat domain-containing protein [Chloroflexota bacterium]|nr:HEAT repeat domain-containing protein [Chloroflexota bacterium]
MGSLAALFATVEAGRGLADVAANTLFVRRVGAESLPALFIGLGVVSMSLALAYGAAIGRFERRRFLVALLVGFAALMLAERLALLAEMANVLPAVWISVYAVAALLLTVVWTVAGSVLDVRQAKRLFPICTGAAIVGSFVGTLAAGPLASALGTENLLVVFAGLLLGAAALTARTVTASPAPGRRSGPDRSFVAALRIGFDDVRSSPLLRLVAIAYVLFAVLLFSVEFSFLRAMGSAFQTEAELATALGLLSAAVTGVSFLVAIMVANRLYARYGIGAAALTLPIVYLVGFGVWLVGFSLATAIGIRFAQQVTQRGVSNAAFGALYNVVPSARRAQALAFVDGVPGQVGTVLSGVLLLAVGALLEQAQVFVLGIVTAAAATVIVLRIRSRYGDTLVRTLRSGLGEQVLEGGPGVAALAHEPLVLENLRAALASPHAGSRRLAAELLGRLGTSEGADAILPALRDEDAEVRAAAVAALAETDPHRLVQHAELVTDSSTDVRGWLAVGVSRAGDDAAAQTILKGLEASPEPSGRAAWLDAIGRLGDPAALPAAAEAVDDASPAVRAAAIRAFGTLSTRGDGAMSRIVQALDDEALVVRRAASSILARRDDAGGSLLDVLRAGSPRAQEAAVEALQGARGAAHEPLRDWALGLIERAAHLRRWSRGNGATPGSAAELLGFTLEQRELVAQRRVLTAIAALGAPEANGTIRRALRSRDAEVRAQAIEALDALGDSHLGRALAALLDTDPGAPAGEHDLASLAEDPDPWISTLAKRARAERDGALATDDGTTPTDPPGGAAMPDPDATLGVIERMLCLRRVPLFDRLAPEDLQRVAAVASERRYAPHEALLTEGDFGDELVIIVEGDVLVVQGVGPDARLIRTYTGGDHIGELAVLRAQPRAATVVAGNDGVHGLVIDGEGLRTILEERPEAALALLATLADRIGTQ